MPSPYFPRPSRRLLHLPVKDWPASDKLVFEQAFGHDAELFGDSGQGSHYAPRTRASIMFCWRRWLGFLQINEPAVLALSPAQRITPERVKAFAKSLELTNCHRSIASVLRFLWYGAQLAGLGLDWEWLKTLVKRFAAKAGAPRHPPLPFNGRQLLNLGLGLMDKAARDLEGAKAIPGGRIPKHIAIDHRDGLLLAILAVFPLRRSNLEGLVLGDTLVRLGTFWQIRLSGEAVKNHEPLNATLPERISRRIDEHRECFRSMINQSHCHRGLWASVKGGPLGGAALYEAFTQRIADLTGHRVRLHDARAIAVTTWTIIDPVGSAAARDLLGNRDSRVIEKHYNRTQAIQASRVLADLKHKLLTGE